MSRKVPPNAGNVFSAQELIFQRDDQGDPDKRVKVKAKSLSRVRLCDPMDCSLPGSAIHGIFQTRVVEWVAISFSRKMYIMGVGLVKVKVRQ